MKKFIFALLCIISVQTVAVSNSKKQLQLNTKGELEVDATKRSHIKIFINDTSRTFTVLIEESNHMKTSVVIPPGAIRNIFLKTTEIVKIVLKRTSNANSSFSGMTHQTFKSADYPINENTMFFISENSNLRMYPANAGLDSALETIAVKYARGEELPPIKIAIHNLTPKNGITQQTTDFFLEGERKKLLRVDEEEAQDILKYL